MSVKGHQLRLAFFVVLLLVAAFNALALWGDDVARAVYGVLQMCLGVGTIVCALVTARRVTGFSRWWRLTTTVSIVGWMAGQYFWLWSDTGRSTGVVPTPGVVAYFVALLAGLVTILLVFQAGSSEHGGPTRPELDSPAATLLDGLITAISFSVMVALAGSTVAEAMTSPRMAGSESITTAYWIFEVVVVVIAVVIATYYPADWPYRANYLLLAAGGLLVAVSDRMVVYLLHVVGDGGELWGGLGFVMSPVLVAYALLDIRRAENTGKPRSRDAMDLVQLSVPYAGFVAIAALFAFHVLNGQRLSTGIVCATVLMVLFVAIRHVAAMRAQRKLTQRLYEAQQRLGHQVHHDSLTGLPNRLLLSQRLTEAMRDGGFVLIFVDLDDFKDVNDRFGHAAGDDLLCAVGERLRRCVGSEDTLARIGGDEFAILIDGEREAPEVVADRLRVALRDPFAIHGSSVRVRASMGLVRQGADHPATSSDDLLRQADISMYAGKRLGKDTAVVYRPSTGASVDFVTALRSAEGGVPDGFRLSYQPVVRLTNGEPVAVEALARWTAHNGIQIPPETFVAAAEVAGLGAVLDGLVLDMACREVADADMSLDLHVNIGAARLGNLDFERQLEHTLDLHGIAPGRLVVEITETLPIVDLADGAAAIRRLTALGVRVALDDFGAGYNSLSYLHALPVQIVKLDRSLAVGAEPEQSIALYRSFIRLCEDLGMDVVAEGIESSAQAETIAEAGCRLAQGHLFGAPAPINALALSRERAGLHLDTP